MTTIVSLRRLALTSNVLFSCGLIAHIYPVVFLHLLLPVNLVKLYRLRWQKRVSGVASPQSSNSQKIGNPRYNRALRSCGHNSTGRRWFWADGREALLHSARCPSPAGPTG